MWEKKIVDGKGDEEEEGGWPTQSKLTRAESQGGDPPNDETCFADLAELWQRVVECGKEDMAGE